MCLDAVSTNNDSKKHYNHFDLQIALLTLKGEIKGQI